MANVSRPIQSFAAQAIDTIIQDEPVVVEFHTNGYCYVRRVVISDLPDYNHTGGGFADVTD